MQQFLRIAIFEPRIALLVGFQIFKQVSLWVPAYVGNLGELVKGAKPKGPNWGIQLGGPASETKLLGAAKAIGILH